MSCLSVCILFCLYVGHFFLTFILQRDLDMFKDVVLNSRRIRSQKYTYLPDGIPEHIYSFPEEYKLKDCGK